MSVALNEIHNKLTYDLEFFAEKAPMMIKPKTGADIPLRINPAQRILHDALEKQKREKGWVRALVLKGRQQGVSTYVNARFYHITRRGSTNTFILSHESKTTDKLFKMVRRFHEGVHGSLRPPASTSNKNELAFNGISSEYIVGTAGNKNTGRGGTVQLFHGSECHFWENTDDIQSGVMESVPLDVGTEVILESTANGMGGMFYDMCMQAMAGLGDYQLVFIPWFASPEYRRQVPSEFTLTDDEESLKKAYSLDNEQIYWRRLKIENAKNGLKQFQREYPCNVMEAFQVSGTGLIDPSFVVSARQSKFKDPQAPLIFGVDPARDGDETVIVFRRGREVPVILSWRNMNSMRLAGIVARLINKYDPAKVFIDVGYGHGTIDRLKELGFSSTVEGINFGWSADQSDLYLNKRAEMWIELRDWMQSGEVNIPDDESLHADLVTMPDFKVTSNGKMQLVSKDKIRSEYGRSPDRGDALALTFAQPVLKRSGNETGSNKIKRKSSNVSRRKDKKPSGISNPLFG